MVATARICAAGQIIPSYLPGGASLTEHAVPWPHVSRHAKRERKCADTIGTVLVPWASNAEI